MFSRPSILFMYKRGFSTLRVGLKEYFNIYLNIRCDQRKKVAPHFFTAALLISQQLIRPLKEADNEKPLKLTIRHGIRNFNVTLQLAGNENGARISMRHLAEVVLHETGILPNEQKYCFRGVTWKNPDLGPWSPALRDLGLKNGDKVQLVAYHQPKPDWEATEEQQLLDKRFIGLLREVHDIFYRLHGVSSAATLRREWEDSSYRRE
ncbi:hypothetical protein PoB_003250500 [Plakobranchus ocellatus]|uniref:Ubiquitin-like domain-containing protein n=1 Tax=Plakobranchus ocellatus TaxID=259542 RepID=A0AAV4AGV8_9GAST|nr:hypothetical protein PoB_003250500 [Plakobranchus ocellatus]